MLSEEKQYLHKACNEMQRAVENLANELALLRNALYQAARPEDFDAIPKPKRITDEQQ